MNSYQRRLRDLRYKQQCIEELEELCKELFVQIPKPRLHLGKGMSGDGFLTPYNTQQFIGELFMGYNTPKDKT